MHKLKYEVDQFFSQKKESKRRGHLDPETRTNLKDEFMQGTNIFMHALRGVGV